MAKAVLREGDIIQALKKALPEGQLVRFTPGPASPRGISDVLITWNGREWFCEIKVNDTKLTRLQAEFLGKRANPMLLHVDTEKAAITCEVRTDQSDAYWIVSMLAKQLWQPARSFDTKVTHAVRF